MYTVVPRQTGHSVTLLPATAMRRTRIDPAPIARRSPRPKADHTDRVSRKLVNAIHDQSSGNHGHDECGSGPSICRRSRHRAPTPGTLRPTQRISSPKPKRESSRKATGGWRQGGQRRPRASARPSIIRRDERYPSKSRAGKSKRPDRSGAARLSTRLTRSFLLRGAVSLPSSRRQQGSWTPGKTTVLLGRAPSWCPRSGGNEDPADEAVAAVSTAAGAELTGASQSCQIPICRMKNKSRIKNARSRILIEISYLMQDLASKYKISHQNARSRKKLRDLA